MALSPSPLHLAADAIAGALADHLTGRGEDAMVSVGTPAAAADAIKGAAAKPTVNLFFYRLAGSGLYPHMTPGEPLMVSLFCLVTAFDKPGAGAGLAELRLLGEAVRFFHTTPVLGPLPEPPQAGMTRYTVSTVLQQPPMEELNHIWGTQGNEAAYRLSASYELGLVPVESLEPAAPAPPVRAAGLDVRPDMDRRSGFGGAARLWPLDPDAAADWLPLALLVDGDRLSTSAELPVGALEVPVALAGPQGEKAAFSLRFLDSAGAQLGSQARQRTIATGRLDHPDARTVLDINPPANTARIQMEVAPVVTAGAGAMRGHPLTVELV